MNKSIVNINQDVILFCNYPVTVKIPFEDCNCANWNDQNNYSEYTGIKYKDKNITLSNLYDIDRCINNSAFGSDYFKVIKATFDNIEVDTIQLKSIIHFIENKMINIKNQYQKRTTRKTYNYYE